MKEVWNTILKQKAAEAREMETALDVGRFVPHTEIKGFHVGAALEHIDSDARFDVVKDQARKHAARRKAYMKLRTAEISLQI